MSEAFKVVITDLITEPLEDERGVLGDIATVTALEGLEGEERLLQIEDADAMMVYHYFRVTEEIIDRLEKCRVIVRPGVGYDAIDIVAARKRGIPVCNVPDYGTEEVADTAMAMTLALARGSHFLNSRLRRGIGPWTAEQAVPIYRLRDRCLGVIGCGRIGSATALRAKAFGLQVGFYDPYLPDGVDKALGLKRYDTLEALLGSSDIVSVHTPLTEETSDMIGADQIASMRDGAYLVNTARGGIVDTDAVVDSLESGKLAGAGIDVLEREPPLPDSHVMTAWRDPNHAAHDRLLLNPHTAYYCEEGVDEFRTKGALEVRRALLGEPLRNVVN